MGNCFDQVEFEREWFTRHNYKVKTFFEYAGFSAEVEEPWKIGIKLMIFSTLVWESKNICRLIVRIFESFVNEIKIKEFNQDPK